MTKINGDIFVSETISKLNELIEEKYLANGANIDNLKYKSGMYGIYGASNPINGNIAVLEVIRYSPDWLLQRLTSIETGNMWERRFVSGKNWTNWVQRW